jgi:hypothetical protein
MQPLLKAEPLLLQAMGGRFKVESVPDISCTFRFTIDVEPADMDQGEAIAQDDKRLADKNCLLIVRNVSLQTILKKQIEGWGVKCMLASTITEAMEALRKVRSKVGKSYPGHWRSAPGR